MKWLEIVKILLQLLPAIITAIKAVEEVLPVSGKGAEKLSLVRGIIESVSEESKAIWPHIEKTITVVVDWFNRVGVFQAVGKA
jgi:hypothetical protein